jgi:choline dehydrogenase-like flavoprotein
LIRSAKTLADGTLLTAEVAVVGAGPIGIVLALELARAGRSVLVIESGGVGLVADAQTLARQNGNDRWHVPSDLAVRRQLGGTSALWGGRCVPFDPWDFDSRPVVREQLWPLPYAEIDQYLEAACAWAQCGHAVFSATELPELAGSQMIPGFADGVVRTTSLERWALPTRFGRFYREQLEAAGNVDLITDMTCTHIACDPATGEVDHLELRTLDGTHASARADAYVLATGGLEATRLLMCSDDVHAGGVGSASGHLGRWYMAHVEARVARMHLRTPPELTIHEHERDADGIYVRRRFTFSPESQREHGLSNTAIWFVNPQMSDPSHGSGILSGVYLTLISPLGRFMLAEGIRKAHTSATGRVRISAHLRNIVRDLPSATRFAASFGYSRFLRRGRKAPGFFVRSAANIYPLDYHGEHLPNSASRVVLTDERDALGMRRIKTEMAFSETDIANVERAMALLDQELRAADVGHLEYLFDDVAAGVRDCLVGSSGYHQTGTTRMAASAEGGVVDANLAVFDAENLFIASTSTFPTSSQANPTLMGIAFAVRLARHLADQLSGSVTASS